MKRILSILYPDFAGGRQAVALLLVRCLVGIAFVLHGTGKASDIAAFAEEFQLPLTMAYAATWSQCAAGIMLLTGLLSPLASFTLASTMFVASTKLIGRGEPFVSPHGHSWEASGFYLAANLALLLLGPGRYALDAMWVPKLRGKSS